MYTIAPETDSDSANVVSSASTTLIPKPATAKKGNAKSAGKQADRFVCNRVEKAWIVRMLTVQEAPLQKMKTLEATCDVVASQARSRYITDATIEHVESTFGMSWRRVYMANTEKRHVQYIASQVPKMAEGVKIDMNTDSDDDTPIALVRPTCEEGGAVQHLDQAVLEFMHLAASRIQTSAEDGEKSMVRQRESRKQKKDRLDRRKRAYATEKDEK